MPGYYGGIMASESLNHANSRHCKHLDLKNIILVKSTYSNIKHYLYENSMTFLQILLEKKEKINL